MATNSLGRDSDMVELVGSPQSVILREFTNNTATKLQVNWSVVSLGDIANTTIKYRVLEGDWTIVTWMHHIDGQTDSVVQEFSQELNNLLPDTQYEVAIFCTNEYGSSELSRSVYGRTRPRGGEAEEHARPHRA